MTFLVMVKTAVMLDIKSRFGVMGFSTSDTIWGLCFLLLFDNTVARIVKKSGGRVFLNLFIGSGRDRASTKSLLQA